MLLCACLCVAAGVRAQAFDDGLAGRQVHRVVVSFDVEDPRSETYRAAVLRAYATYPGMRYDPTRHALLQGRVKRLNFVGDVQAVSEANASGGVDLVLKVTLSDAAASLSRAPTGLLSEGGGGFPLLYADDRVSVAARLENKTMMFSNTNAFFARPDVLTAGNPLAEDPSGSGTDTWLETSVQAGVYAIANVNGGVSVFGGASYLYSASVGPELFTDRTRTHAGIEDAYAGFSSDRPTASGGNRQFTLLYGRKAFQVDNGMILRLSSANGGERAALQSNPRNAAERLLLAQFSYDAHRIEAFRIDPDELEELDSRTLLEGLNYEGQVGTRLRVGAMLLRVPESTFSYYTVDSVLPREGLRVADLRLSYEAPLGRPGWFLRGELARQTHPDFPMDARAGYAEVGYAFAASAWKPSLSYRYSHFSGDDPDTAEFERWDPLFAGGGGDEWVQGLNHYKVVQTSNVDAHRLMVRLRPNPRWELVPQLWRFRADQRNNLGGAQALSFLSSHDLGREANLTARYVHSARLIFVFSAAHTRPGQAIRDSLGGDYRNWSSASALAIARF
jgi:hypothetical protein